MNIIEKINTKIKFNKILKNADEPLLIKFFKTKDINFLTKNFLDFKIKEKYFGSNFNNDYWNLLIDNFIEIEDIHFLFFKFLIK